MNPTEHITRVLTDGRDGRAERARELIPMVYPDLRDIARRAIARERPGHTLQPTALVHEAVAVLIDSTRVDWQGLTHFRAVAARCMRNILVDHARRRAALRRGGDRTRIDIEPQELALQANQVDVLEIDEVLHQLAEQSPRAAELVELRFFGGLTEQETAEAMGVSERTVRREWTTARAWLRARLGPPGG